MAALSKLLRSVEGNRLMFYCPGCKENHMIRYGNGAWSWNGDVDKPTFSPSVLTRGHQIERDENGKWTGEWIRDENGNLIPSVCHMFVRDGQIQFLNDCTHELKDQTVPMVEWTEDDS